MLASQHNVVSLNGTRKGKLTVWRCHFICRKRYERFPMIWLAPEPGWKDTESFFKAGINQLHSAYIYYLPAHSQTFPELGLLLLSIAMAINSLVHWWTPSHLRPFLPLPYKNYWLITAWMTVLISGTVYAKTQQAAWGTWSFLNALVVQKVFPQPFSPLIYLEVWAVSPVFNAAPPRQDARSYSQHQPPWWHILLPKIKTMHSEKGY